MKINLSDFIISINKRFEMLTLKLLTFYPDIVKDILWLAIVHCITVLIVQSSCLCHAKFLTIIFCQIYKNDTKCLTIKHFSFI